MSQLSTVMEELSRLKTFNARLEVLEQDRPELRDQADQEHDGKRGGAGQSVASSCYNVHSAWRRLSGRLSFIWVRLRVVGYC